MIFNDTSLYVIYLYIMLMGVPPVPQVTCSASCFGKAPSALRPCQVGMGGRGHHGEREKWCFNGISMGFQCGLVVVYSNWVRNG